MRRKRMAVQALVALVLLAGPVGGIAEAAPNLPDRDSKELRLQDMLMTLLQPKMEAKLRETYAKWLKGGPELYPYFVNVIKTERVNGFRGFDMRITIDAYPTVGPHIPVGEDRFTFAIAPGAGAKIVGYEHLKDPNPKDFPPNYKDLLKKGVS